MLIKCCYTLTVNIGFWTSRVRKKILYLVKNEPNLLQSARSFFLTANQFTATSIYQLYIVFHCNDYIHLVAHSGLHKHLKVGRDLKYFFNSISLHTWLDAIQNKMYVSSIMVPHLAKR